MTDSAFLLPAMAQADYAELATRIRHAFQNKLREQRLDASLEEPLCRVYLPLADWIHRQKKAGRGFVLGVNGAQGSGKSTLCEFLRLILREGYGYKVAGFSLDDLYKTKAEREMLARTRHPLLKTRGVPGTHDVELGLAILCALLAPGRIAIPSFDKARDDRRPKEQWPVFDGPADVVIFEGWCVGTRPQPDDALLVPVNELERLEDPGGLWRRHVNEQLRGPYATLFARIDRLLFLKVPDMESVFKWRGLQEQRLAEANGGRASTMDASALRRFVMHCERLTRHNLEEMPSRADLGLCLDKNHRFTHPSNAKP